MPWRLCLQAGCGTLTCASRCAVHEAERVAVRTADRPIARAVVAASPVCSCQGCKRHKGPCGSTVDLTADHVVPLARGGSNAGERVVLCRSCNAIKASSRS